MYKLIIEKGLKCSLPNVKIVLRIYLVLMVTNCITQRCISKLKLVKYRTSNHHDSQSIEQSLNNEYGEGRFAWYPVRSIA